MAAGLMAGVGGSLTAGRGADLPIEGGGFAGRARFGPVGGKLRGL